MPSCCLILLALLLPPQRFLANVSGQILDREGKPMVGAQITYTQIGLVDRNINVSKGSITESPKMVEGTGRIYKTKTDKKGAFALMGMEYGVYQIEITSPDGGHVYSGKKIVDDNNDPKSQNMLNVDLSTAIKGRVEPGAETNLAAGKKTKEQLDLIRQENSNAAKINRLIVRYHAALDIQDWLGAISLLQELIAVDSNRWEFYQNLGTLQGNQSRYQEAAESFAKGVEVAQKLLANPSDTDRAQNNIADLLIAEAECYDRLDKVEEAVALYDKAAAISPHPAMAHLRACNALTNKGKTEAAIEKCSQAIVDDPAQWEAYQILGSAFNTANKPNDAIQAYEKGVAAARKILEEKPDSGRAKTGLGQMLNSEGNLLVQQKKYDEAIVLFTEAAEISAYPAMPYFNLCAIYYNQKRAQDAVQACDRAIASDPTMSDAYYIKASILFGQGRAENRRYVVPPGTSESLNKYLEYAPFGQYAITVRAMLQKLNEELDVPYKPAKK